MSIFISLLAFLVVFILAVAFLANYNIWRREITLDAPRVLMYHSISETPNCVHPELSVKPDNFNKQINHLRKQGFNFYTVSEIANSSPRTPAVALTFDDGFSDNYNLVFPILKKLNIKATIYVAPHIEGISKLSEQQIFEMHSSGLVEFGAHTLSHANLSTLDITAADQEISGSKLWLENVTKTPCRSFAYPFGRFNNATVELI
jgi:peptidoglycan/xylan/chitin deacetylase (PgdA/CDA1 family)